MTLILWRWPYFLSFVLSLYCYCVFRNLEALLTSWLQTALHYDPEKRGSRRKPGEDAVCLSNMDHILSTRVRKGGRGS